MLDNRSVASYRLQVLLRAAGLNAAWASAGIPCVNIGPGGLPYNFAEEYVLQDEYLNAVRTYVAAALDFCNRAPA